MLQILTAEDNPGDVLFLGEVLKEQQLSYKLHIARDGEAAAKFVNEMGERDTPPFRGLTAKEVASELNISVRTAEFHKVTIMHKLGIRTTAQLTRFALENGFG